MNIEASNRRLIHSPPHHLLQAYLFIRRTRYFEVLIMILD